MKRSCGIVSEIFLLAALSALIGWISLLPPSAGESLYPFSDKIGHGLAYCALGAVSAIVFSHSIRNTDRYWRRIAAAVLVYVLVLGFTIELLQPSFGRTFDMFDALADAIGGIIGFSAYRIYSMIADRFMQSGSEENQ